MVFEVLQYASMIIDSFFFITAKVCLKRFILYQSLTLTMVIKMQNKAVYGILYHTTISLFNCRIIDRRFCVATVLVLYDKTQMDCVKRVLSEIKS